MDTTKKYLYAAGVVALLVISYSVFSYANSYGKMIQPGSYRSFAVTGEGQATAKNDIAEFTYSVTIQGGKDIAQIKKQSDDITAKVKTFLKSEGVDEKDIKTVSYNLDPRYQYSSCPPVRFGEPATVCRPSEIVGYTLNQTDSIKIRDLSKVDKIVSGVVAAGVNSVSQLQFTVDNLNSLRTEAKAAAVKEAITQAESLAKAAGFRVGKIISIDEGFVPVPYGMGGGGVEMMAKDSAQSVSSVNIGSNEVRSNVTVRFEIR